MSRAGQIRLTYGVIIVIAIVSLLPTLWAASAERERPVPDRPPADLRADLDERPSKRVEAVSGLGGHGHDGRALEERTGRELAHLEAHELQRVGVHHV